MIIKCVNMNYWIYFAICCRFMGAMSICPLFNDSLLPRTIKMMLAMLFSLLLVPCYLNNPVSSLMLLNALSLGVELCYGALIGYVLSLPLWLVENVGNLIDIQRGEQFGATVNQLTKNPASSISKLILQGFMGYFASIGGILYFIKIIGLSFLIVAPGKFLPNALNIELIIRLFSSYFYWIIVLALPIIFAMYLLELTLGLFSTFVQQLNVTVLSMPLKSMLALFVLAFYLASFYHFVIVKFVNNEVLEIFSK